MVKLDGKSGTWLAVDHGILSPSGHVSKRSRKAALERARVELFGEKGLATLSAPQPTGVEYLFKRIGELEGLANRGMSPRKHRREAAKLLEKVAVKKREEGGGN